MKMYFKKIIVAIVLLLITLMGLFALQLYKNNQDLYEKLYSKKKINILIVGDSIGAGQGAEKHFFGDLLKEHLIKTYDIDVKLDNISIGATTSFCGYSILRLFKKYTTYDLVIVCYGHNDQNENFKVFYEELINLIQRKYPKCEIISILEASKFQNDSNYKEKMEIIKDIALKHKIMVANVISDFSNSPYNLKDLTDEYDVHPNDKGQAIYFKTIKETLENNIKEKQRVNSFKKIKFYKISNFKRINNLTYEIKIHKDNAYLGIDYIYHYGKNLCEVYVDDKKIFTLETDDDFPNNVKHRRITNINLDTIKVNENIKLKFKDKKEIKFFNGLIITSSQ